MGSGVGDVESVGEKGGGAARRRERGAGRSECIGYEGCSEECDGRCRRREECDDDGCVGSAFATVEELQTGSRTIAEKERRREAEKALLLTPQLSRNLGEAPELPQTSL